MKFFALIRNKNNPQQTQLKSFNDQEKLENFIERLDKKDQIVILLEGYELEFTKEIDVTINRK